MLPVGRRREIAERLNVQEQYIYQVLKGCGVASPALARKLNAEAPELQLCDLRPDDWQEIWPELADLKPNPPQVQANPSMVAIKNVARGVANA